MPARIYVAHTQSSNRGKQEIVTQYYI